MLLYERTHPVGTARFRTVSPPSVRNVISWFTCKLCSRTPVSASSLTPQILVLPKIEQTKRLTKPGIDPSIPAETRVMPDSCLSFRNEARQGVRKT